MFKKFKRLSIFNYLQGAEEEDRDLEDRGEEKDVAGAAKT